MNLPLVSVVMAVYNSEKYVNQAIDSVLAQSYQNLELVIIDDGSSDSSKKIILSYTDPRVRVLENEHNAGIVFTRNKGLESARGTYIATLDSDDVALPGRIERQVDFLEKNPGYGLCGTFYDTIDENGRLLKKIQYPTNNQDIITFLTLGNCFCNSTVMMRTELATELRYKEAYYIGEDYDLWCRISKKAKVANLPFYGAYYRVHPNSITVSKTNDMFALVKKINGSILGDLQIGFSEKELETHAFLLNRNIGFFQDETHFKELEEWTYRFYTYLKKDAKYNDLLLYKLIAEKWIVIVFNTKRYKKLFRNRLFKLNRMAYLSCLWKRILIKITNEQ